MADDEKQQRGDAAGRTDGPAEKGGDPRGGGGGAEASGPQAGGTPGNLEVLIARKRAELRRRLREKASQSGQGDAGDAEAAESGQPDATGEAGDDRQAAGGEAAASGQAPAGRRGPAEAPSAEAAATAEAAAGQAHGGATGPAVEDAEDAGSDWLEAGPGGEGERGRMTFTHVMLAVNLFVLAGLGGVLVYMLRHRAAQPTSADAAIRAVAVTQRQQDHPRPGAIDANVPVIRPEAVPTWRAAETAFGRGDYDLALDRYSRLLLANRKVPADALVGEFFQLRIAQCLRQVGRQKEARRLMGRLSASASPVICASAGAALAGMDEAEGQWLQTRMRAYRGLAALGAMETQLALEADCDYLAARALTRKVQSFYSSEQVIPWSGGDLSDAFSGRDEPSLRRLLAEGTTELNRSVLSPEVQISPAGTRWTVGSSRAALEDLLHQLAARIGRDMQWKQVPPSVRRRRVSFHLRAASEQRAFEVACGLAGLAARFTWDQVVVYDPQSLTSVTEQRDLLAREAISSWRRFSLRFPEDKRVAQGQFALAALLEWSGDTLGALRQYQLVSRRHEKDTEVAPRALMRCAKIRIQLRDYAGAKTDLLDLRDLYPQYPASDEVDLYLGRVSMQAGLLDDAIRVFSKVYYFNSSAETRRSACLGAGECHYRKGEYKDASMWTSRYVASVKSISGGELVRAYLLLGRSEAAQGNYTVAAEAFRRALAARPDRKQYVEAVLALAKARGQMENFVGAMGTLGRIDTEQLTPQQTYEKLMLVSWLYRRMGLPDRARAALRKRSSALADPQMQASIEVELARCLAESGDLRGARQRLSGALPRLKAGQDAWEAAMELAEICLRTNDVDQAIIVSREVLRGRCPEAIRRRASEVLGRAYLRKKQYAEAAAALSSLPATGKGKEKGKSE